jgi:hypothetical protein
VKRALLIVLASACRANDPAPATTTQSPGCDRDIAAYLAALAAEGPPDMSETIVPVSLDVTASAGPQAPAITVATDVVTFQGQIVAETSAHDLADRIGDAAIPAGPIELHIDRAVPWASVSAIVGALAQGGRTQLVFEVAALRRTAKPPRGSTIDGALHEWDRKFDALPIDQKLGSPPAFDIPKLVYKDCPAALQLAPQQLAAQLPATLAACDCKVEVPAVERLLWRLWGMDARVAHAWMPVTIGQGAAVIQPAKTAWGDAAQTLFSTAKLGPVRLGSS